MRNRTSHRYCGQSGMLGFNNKEVESFGVIRKSVESSKILLSASLKKICRVGGAGMEMKVFGIGRVRDSHMVVCMIIDDTYSGDGI